MEVCSLQASVTTGEHRAVLENICFALNMLLVFGLVNKGFRETKAA